MIQILVEQAPFKIDKYDVEGYVASVFICKSFCLIWEEDKKYVPWLLHHIQVIIVQFIHLSKICGMSLYTKIYY